MCHADVFALAGSWESLPPFPAAASGLPEHRKGGILRERCLPCVSKDENGRAVELQPQTLVATQKRAVELFQFNFSMFLFKFCDMQFYKTL